MIVSTILGFQCHWGTWDTSPRIRETTIDQTQRPSQVWRLSWLAGMQAMSAWGAAIPQGGLSLCGSEWLRHNPVPGSGKGERETDPLLSSF